MHQSNSVLIGCSNSVHWSWTTRSEWRVMASGYFQGNLSVKRKIVHWLILVPCVESMPRLVYCESVWKSDLLSEFPASKETSGKQWKFQQNIALLKQLNENVFCYGCEAADVSNKENLLLSSAMSTHQRIFERSFLVSTTVEILDVRTHFKPTETFQYTNLLPPYRRQESLFKGKTLRLMRTNS